MSSSQRTRRKSDQLAGDDGDARPSKRQKTDDVGGAASKQTNGRKTATTSKKAKTAYEEDADGFQFSRAKTKKAPNKPTPVPQPPKDNEPMLPDPNPQPVKGGRSKRSLGRAPLGSEAQKADPEPRRRSARLSGDQEQVKTGPQVVNGEAGAPQTAERRVAQTPGSSDIRVEKRRGTTRIALPFADTPVIMRNKEMRKNSADGRRRSSSGMRGRRASSLIDSGASNGETESDSKTEPGASTEEYIALPHAEVATADFYKHIHQDLSEPRRMKQLLIWCGTRALPERPTGSAEEVNAGLAARTIQEELLRDFSNRNEMSDWFNRADVAPTALVKKPNPRNLQNAAKLQELEQEVKRLRVEKAAWDGVLESLSASEQHFGPLLDPDPSAALLSEQIVENLLDEPEQVSILAELSSHTSNIANSKSRLKAATRQFEFKVDSFADGVHKVKKLKETGDGTVDGILSRAATALEERDRAASASAGTEKVSIGDLLRSLSRAT